ncbi:uncharacterized protein LOC135370165 [Ornithodoros turicata]|uniref:uncharacterized protein LOC135370165 n=1 Tax=Ornithodoros turicata TaxID=34597 RepID=UPI0031393CC1
MAQLYSILVLAIATGVNVAQDCGKTSPDDATMKKAGEIAAELMKQCVHLLDKYPVPLSTIADAMKVLCTDYAMCHDKHENLAGDPTKYRTSLVECVRPYMIKYYKSRPEFKHDPEQVATEVGDCVINHIPLSKEMGMATGYWLLKIMGAHES